MKIKKKVDVILLCSVDWKLVSPKGERGRGREIGSTAAKHDLQLFATAREATFKLNYATRICRPVDVVTIAHSSCSFCAYMGSVIRHHPPQN